MASACGTHLYLIKRWGGDKWMYQMSIGMSHDNIGDICCLLCVVDGVMQLGV